MNIQLDRHANTTISVTSAGGTEENTWGVLLANKYSVECKKATNNRVLLINFPLLGSMTAGENFKFQFQVYLS